MLGAAKNPKDKETNTYHLRYSLISSYKKSNENWKKCESPEIGEENIYCSAIVRYKLSPMMNICCTYIKSRNSCQVPYLSCDKKNSTKKPIRN
jgi:hypothetical protein